MHPPRKIDSWTIAHPKVLQLTMTADQLINNWYALTQQINAALLLSYSQACFDQLLNNAKYISAIRNNILPAIGQLSRDTTNNNGVLTSDGAMTWDMLNNELSLQQAAYGTTADYRSHGQCA